MSKLLLKAIGDECMFGNIQVDVAEKTSSEGVKTLSEAKQILKTLGIDPGSKILKGALLSPTTAAEKAAFDISVRGFWKPPEGNELIWRVINRWVMLRYDCQEDAFCIKNWWRTSQIPPQFKGVFEDMKKCPRFNLGEGCHIGTPYFKVTSRSVLRVGGYKMPSAGMEEAPSSYFVSGRGKFTKFSFRDTKKVLVVDFSLINLVVPRLAVSTEDIKRVAKNDPLLTVI